MLLKLHPQKDDRRQWQHAVFCAKLIRQLHLCQAGSLGTEDLALPPEEKLLFRLGRRGGVLRSLDELDNPDPRRRLEFAMHDLVTQTGGDLEFTHSPIANSWR